MKHPIRFQRLLLMGILLISFLIIPIPLQRVHADPDQEVIRPNATGTNTDYMVYNAANDYTAMSDNNPATYISSATVGHKDTMNLGATSGSGTINWVEFIAMSQASGGGPKEYVDILMYVSGSEYVVANHVQIPRSPGGNITTGQMSTSPATESAWTWSELDGAEAGSYVDTVGGGEWVGHAEIWIIIDYTPGVSDTDPPQIEYDTATGVTNSSSVACFTSIFVNWSITDANPARYDIYSNETGSNVSRIGGTFTSGNYYTWTFENTNTSNTGLDIFFQCIANDTGGYRNASIIIVTISSFFSLNIVEAEGAWTIPFVVKGSGVWVYLDDPAKQFLNLSIQASGNWEVRAYINDTRAELDIKAYMTDSTGGSMPEVETWWDTGGLQLTGSEQVITGGDNQAAGDYSATEDHYGLWLVIQVQDGGDNYYGVLLTLIIYAE